jgi:hypothetical protein
MSENRPRWQRTKRHNSTAADCHRSVSVSHRKRRPGDHRAVVDGDQRNRPAANGTARQDRPRNHPVAGRQSAVPRAAVETQSPPRRTAAETWGPAPSEIVVVVPGTTLERHITPRVSRHPQVAITRSPHPVSVSVRVKGRARCLVRRPDVALARHVVPVAICVKIVPRRVLAFAQIG